jgi:PAS domain-containing protein
MRPDIDSTQPIQRPVWQNPRVHLLDDIWLLTIIAVIVTIGIPWASVGFEAQLASVSWGLLGLGAIHVAFTLLASPAASPGRWRGATLTTLDAIGVVLIGFVWAHAGGLQNPLFLTVFVLPVVGSIFLSRWHPFMIAVLSILVVAAVALGQAPELRSYLSTLLGSESWLAEMGKQSSDLQTSFPGFYAPTSYLVALLEVFTVVLLACAVAAEYLGTIFERILASSVLARSESEQAQKLWATLIERLPIPALLIDPNSLRIVGCSDVALAYLHGDEGPFEGRNLFEVARFSFADLIQEIIAGASGGASLTAIHIGDEVRLTQVRVLQVAHKKRRLALLTLEDATEAFCLRAALDTSEYAALVVDSAGRIRALNRLSVELFGGAQVGANADQLLVHTVSGLRWWEPGLTRRRKMHIDIGSRIYEVTSSEVALPDEEQRLYSVSFLPVARAEPLETAAKRLVQLRTPQSAPRK